MSTSRPLPSQDRRADIFALTFTQAFNHYRKSLVDGWLDIARALPAKPPMLETYHVPGTSYEAGQAARVIGHMGDNPVILDGFYGPTPKDTPFLDTLQPMNANLTSRRKAAEPFVWEDHKRDIHPSD